MGVNPMKRYMQLDETEVEDKACHSDVSSNHNVLPLRHRPPGFGAADGHRSVGQESPDTRRIIRA